MMMLAAFTILKLKKSSFLRYLDIESVKCSYFSAIALARKVSIENNGIPAKSTQVLKQLWLSHKVFMEDDEIEGSLKSRIRSRLAMSLAVDCLWWWKEEFNQSRENQVRKEASAEKDIRRGSGLKNANHSGSTLQMGVDAAAPSALESTSFQEFDWFDTIGFADPDWRLPGMDGEISTNNHIELDV
ncbi:MAG: hypothetical protein M1830_003195 [Pleopsidium flavum]|nr:MAG: hypothetical protein M1830_003195 [Pleopsidium flavum]